MWRSFRSKSCRAVGVRRGSFPLLNGMKMKTCDHSEKIEEYVKFFKNRTKEIGEIDALPLFRKILYLVEIDTLSRAAFPEENGHKDRVIKFLDQCSNWCDKDRVSAIHLKQSLEDNEKQSGPLLDLVNERINSWPHEERIKPGRDLTLQEVREQAKPAEQKLVHETRYMELFYRYRNSLIHEFREPPEWGHDLASDSVTPFYCGMDFVNGNDKWKLVFPVKFLEHMCENCVRGIEEYLVRNNQNPYDSYDFLADET